MLRSRIPAAARAALHARRVAPSSPLPSLYTPARAVNTSAVGTTVVKDNGDSLTLQHPEEYFQAYKTDIPSLQHNVDKDHLVQIYNDMVSMRRMEMACDQLYKAKMIRGFCHLAIGQEAVSVGMHHAIKPDDKIITAYRCHPFAVLRGGTIKGVIAELLGREDGMSHGKGGSMHIFTPTFFGGNGIVGAQVPLGAGIAFAQQYLGQDNEHATFAMYGDGASNQGQVFEAYNMAKLWNLPCVFVCENNLYGMGTSAARSSSNTKYFQRGDQIPGIQVNGMDVLAVMRAVKFAKEWTTSGKGPLLLEMVTYRYGGHSMSDPGTTYRTREEIQHMRSSNDPITGLKNLLLEWGVVEEAQLKKIDKDARAVVEQAVAEAKASPEPSLTNTLWRDIYYKGTNPMWLRGREREEIHHFDKSDSDLYEDGAPQFGSQGSNKMDSLTSTV
ncbi:alpha subunit of pyruvate dehydrogenase [Rhodotorula kratochvilovae]